MRYQIIYQEGCGGKEQNKLRTINKRLLPVNYNINIVKLKNDITMLKPLNHIKPQDENDFNKLELQHPDILDRINTMNTIKITIENYIKLNKGSITNELVNKSNDLEIEYNKQLLIIKTYYEKFKLLSDKIEQLLQLYGSEASSLIDIAKDFGELESSSESLGIIISDESSPDDDYDFM